MTDDLRNRGERLPPGRHGLPRAFVISNQRDRIVDALARVCETKGYGAVTVEDIISSAGVSRRTFYDLFSDKEQCFLVAYDTVIGRTLRTFQAAYDAGDEQWPDRLAAGLAALVREFVAEPALARLAVVEVLGAGRRALEARDASLRHFERFFGPGAAMLPDGMTDPELIAHAVVGGIYEALYGRIVSGETATLPTVLPDLVYCALVPYLGHHEALARRAGIARGAVSA